mmetsp:Transcript_5408/g.11365  ORF Transcript_5408/g.11365 Transcript_5408/m.11365 type:complete len:87 (+) Transcript_5408:1365-1625(+)
MLLFREIRAEPNRNGTVIRGLSFDRIWNNGTRNETLETMERGGVHTQQQQQQQQKHHAVCVQHNATTTRALVLFISRTKEYFLLQF